LGVFEELTKTTIVSEEMKNHNKEEDRVHTSEVNKKKKNFHEKGAKQRGQDQSGLKYNAS
jgi:hypothetical protein